jgi:putative component of membrane protein insertase Oxa1/YidC/SpoIIIJ protein YidD
MIKMLAGLITFYQNFISPRKGFSCAYFRLYGGYSCSEAVKQLILIKGLAPSLNDIRYRFQDCRDAAVTLQKRPRSEQRGDLDCDFISCNGRDDTVGAECCVVWDLSKRLPKRANLGKEGILGKVGTLETDVDVEVSSNRHECTVRVEGETWSAILVNNRNSKLSKGAKIVVIEIRGLILLVDEYHDA